MSTTITAGNPTNGLSLSADNTGILEFKTGNGLGTTALTLSTSQVATFANSVGLTSLTSTGDVTSAGLVSGATGALYPIVSGTAVASTSGTSIDFTSIPSWVKRITVMFNAVSTTGTSQLLVQLGDAGGIETTGYVGALQINGAGITAFSSGINVFDYGANTQAANGQLVLSLLNSSTNIWVGSAVCADGTGGRITYSSGAKTLSPGPLTTIRITTVLGTPTFDAGSINILYE